MLQIKSISKEYVTGDLHQKALDEISLNLRDNEFVAVLGPSGSGKTTLLNIIGGLDRYDSGDLIIDGISTKKYKNRDWDSYRNHTIGFVFQSYNLIPHQSILANVELALTISGVSRSERKKRAKEALEQVGLGDQLHKRPNQMSGGQMQRVAIARALVNNPKILLADEPTGALDTETSIQVMDLLKEVAKDRLVVMVTHNPELADRYATRIVKLKDGKVTDDSDPFEIEEEGKGEPVHKNMGKASMSFLTSLSLSFNNLRTKKARTILTAFAGSIGIIGIALILSLSNGVSNFITDQQKKTMNAYPITIEAQAMDYSAFIDNRKSSKKSEETERPLDGVYSDNSILELASMIRTNMKKNNLTEFKKYLDDPSSPIHQYVGENGIHYSYNTSFAVFSYDPTGALVNLDGSMFYSNQENRENLSSFAIGTEGIYNMTEIMSGSNGSLVSSAVSSCYDLVYGNWPTSYDEIVLVLEEDNSIRVKNMYDYGLLPKQEYLDIRAKLKKSETIELEEKKLSYEEVMNHVFYLVPASARFVKSEGGFYSEVRTGDPDFSKVMEQAIPLKISGIIRIKSDSEIEPIQDIGYTTALTDYLISYAEKSTIVQEQLASPDTSVINGARFSPSDDKEKIQDAKNWLKNLTIDEKAELFRDSLASYTQGDEEASKKLRDMTNRELAAMLEQFVEEAGDQADEIFLSVYNAYISVGTYEENMLEFGYVNRDMPNEIYIYADSFEGKEGITSCIDAYNESAKEEDQLLYTDFIGLLMSSVTQMVDVITYVLIAFVAVSLIVSSIMIGIITYISVLERTKEIGILRAIGASKRNISRVFNAETFIIGLLAGILGISITLLLLIPGNMIIDSLVEVSGVKATLPIAGAVILIVLSVILTLIGGFIPSKKAAKKDPVAALRTE